MYAALRGDPSDNLPGVPGVGEKTAAKLINTYGDLDGVFANVDKNTPKLRENLIAHEAQVAVERPGHAARCATSRSTCDVDDLKMGGWDVDEVRNLFTFLEFRTLWDRLVEAVGPPWRARPRPRVRSTPRPSRSTSPRLQVGQGASPRLDVGRGGRRRGRARRAGRRCAGVALVDADAARVHWAGAELLGALGAGAHGPRAGRSTPTTPRRSCARCRPLGVDFDSLRLDTAIAAYLVDPAEDAVPARGPGPASTPTSRCARPTRRPPGQLDLSGTATDPAEEAGRRAAAVAPPARAAVGRPRGARPAAGSTTTSSGRWCGCWRAWRTSACASTSTTCASLVDALTDEVRTPRRRDPGAGRPPVHRQLDQAAAHGAVRRARPRAAEEDEDGLLAPTPQSLEKLKGQHPIIDKLLRYREVEKLRSTYGESLLAEVGPDGRIHATFQQTVARTGRLSSDRPNLHNIPIRTEEGRAVPAGLHPRGRAGSCSSPTTTRSSCGSSPTWPRTPGSSRRSRRATTSTPRPRRGSSRSSPAT